MRRSLAILLTLTTPVACKDNSVAAERRIPTSLTFVGTTPASAVAGSSIGALQVMVSDERGPIPGVLVSFAVSLGGGRVNPARATTSSDGTASVSISLGTAAGQNQVSALVAGLPLLRSASILGVAGAPDTLTLATRAVRLSATQDSVVIGAVARDGFLNATGQPVTWTSRNPALVGVTVSPNNSGVVRVASRPGQTYVVAGSASVTDSVLVTVHDGTSTPCTFLALPVVLDVGGSLSFSGATPACVRSSDAGAEYALIAHYNTVVAGTQVTLEIITNGISTVSAPFPAAPTDAEPSLRDAFAFDQELRRRERAEMGARAVAARAWMASRRAALSATTTEGDVLGLNVNAFDFCSNPDSRAARVVAISNGAIILADTSNPVGGFTDAEYRQFAAAMDTLVIPVDTSAFGAPSDIDRNGRVAVLFTSAVNALTPRGSGGIVLGFFYGRDLLPRQGGGESCPGSNVSEMFYLLVPDPDAVAGDARSKELVQAAVLPTIAHEYQHLINASRRMFVTEAPEVSEETWLNEGLSHVAEELVFYRASGLSPRQNIGGAQLQIGSGTRTMFDAFQRDNFGRYRQFLRAPDANSPMAINDLVASRGATWAFLRYVADRARPADGDFWRTLVDGRLTGTLNLDAALAPSGTTSAAAMNDWSIAVLTDDNPVASSFQQRSWDFVTGLPATGLSFTLVPTILQDGTSGGITLRSAGSYYARFAVPQQREALIQVGGPAGTPLAQAVRLTIVRIR